jgi:glucose/mannose-6-phosphate isomerase
MLNELEEIKTVDKNNLIEIYLNFPDHIEEAIKIGESAELDEAILNFPELSNIVISGIGGSAIGGDILNSWLLNKLSVPIIINRDYSIPSFSNENTLLIGVSYSGNTQETLDAVAKGLDQNCRIVCVTSGGKLERFCIENNLSVIKVPELLPPRSATGYLLTSLALILSRMNLIDVNAEFQNTIAALRKLRDNLKPEVPMDENPAKNLALSIKDTYPVIYAYGYLLPIARRWKTQFNENSKILAGFDAFPECSHNDIVGWAEDEDYVKQQFSVIYLRTEDEPSNVRDQIEFTKQLLENKVHGIFEIKSPEGSRLYQMLYLMYLGDFVSLYLAVLRGVDPMPIEAIDNMKEAIN